MYICPHDLMLLDRDGSATGHAMKAFNQEPEQCWECYACVKICPQQAIDVKGYADFVPMGASVVPLRGSEDIMWTVKFRSGALKRFKFPIRTTPEGEAKPDGGFGVGPGVVDRVQAQVPDDLVQQAGVDINLEIRVCHGVFDLFRPADAAVGKFINKLPQPVLQAEPLRQGCARPR